MNRDPFIAEEQRREQWRTERHDELRGSPKALAEAIGDRTFRQEPGALLDLLEALTSNENCDSASDAIKLRYASAEAVIDRLIQECVDAEEKHQDFSE